MGLKIERIDIEGFCGIRQASIRTASGCLLLGRNGEGKSSVLHAIRMALWGRCKHTDRAGRGADALINDDADEAKVLLTGLAGEMQFTMGLTITRKGKVAVRGGLGHQSRANTGEELRALIFDAAGVNSGHAEIAADPLTYLHSRELSDALGQMLGQEIAEAEVLAYAGEHAEALRADPAFVASKCSDIAGLKLYGDSVYAERRHDNTRLKAIVAELATIGDLQAPLTSKGNPMGPEHIGAAVNALRAIEADRDKLHVELGRAQAKPIGDLDKLRAQLQAATEAFETADATFRQRARDLEGATDRKRKLGSDIQGLMQRASTFRAAASSAERDLAKAQAEYDTAKDGTCPVCKRKLPRSQIDAGALQRSASAVAKLKLARDETTATMKEIEESLSVARKEMEALDQEIADLQDAYGKLGVEARSLENKKNSLKSQVNALATDCGDPEAIQKELAEIEQRIAQGRAAVSNLEQMKRRDALQREKASVEKGLVFLNWAVDAFYHGEYFKKAAADRSGAFVEQCNAALKPHGYALKLHADGKQIAVLLSRNGGRWRPVRMASEGQQTLVAYALATAFGQGAVVCLDNVDLLDPTNKRNLFLDAKSATWGTPILAGAWFNDDTAALAKAVHPIACYWIEDGAVKADGRAAA